jgi:hypothetical protein
LRGHNFDGDFAAKLRIESSVSFPHPSRTERSRDFVVLESRPS